MRDTAQVVEALLRAYRAIAVEMAELPIVNPRLSVDALGFREWSGGHAGIVVTPWFMNVVIVLPEGSRVVEPGTRVARQFPAGQLEFVTSVLDGVGQGTWEWHPASGEAHFSPGWHALTGIAPGAGAAGIEHWIHHVHPEDVGRVLGGLEAHIDGEGSEFDCAHRIGDGEGGWRWVRARGRIVERTADAAPLALMVPLFSTVATVPDKSTMARAVPVSPARAVIVPLLRISATLPPASTTMPVVIALAALPPDASTRPATRISGVVVPCPTRMAVAEAPFEVAVTPPLIPTPPLIVTFRPRPPNWIAVASRPA